MKHAAVIIGANGGIGRALAEAIEEENEYEHVIRLARSVDSADHIDIAKESSVQDAASKLRQSNIIPSLIVTATGLLHNQKHGPEKSLKELDSDWLLENYAVNAIGPALVAKHFIPLMPKGQRSIFAAISARVGSISDNRLGGWYGYRASKAALNMMIRNIAIEWSRQNNRTIAVALHPGTVDTMLSKPFQGNVSAASLFDAERAALQLLDVIDTLKPSDSGKIFAWDGEEIQP